MKTLQPLLFAVLTTTAMLVSVPGIHARILYVKAGAAGAANGSSWTNAFTTVQAGIDAAVAGDTVFVSGGVYFPTKLHQGSQPRNATFFINKDIVVYGGFSGDVGTEGNFSGRDLLSHPSTLSGDIGILNDSTDNAFHVVFIDHVSELMRLDGFIIEKGNGLNGSPLESTGTGIFNNGDAGRSHPVLANLIVRRNHAIESAGGLFNSAGLGGKANPVILNSSFIFNSASGGGGILSLTDTEGTANVQLINCRFQGNTARTAQGSAMQAISHSGTASFRLVNTIVSGNHIGTSGAAIEGFVTGTGVCTIELINSTVSGNTGGATRLVNLGNSPDCVLRCRNSIIYGNAGGNGIFTSNATLDIVFSVAEFMTGEGIIGLDPVFVSQPPINGAHTQGDLHLRPESPVIDMGRNSDIPVGLALDLDGKPRNVNALNGNPGTVDMGAFEFQPEIPSATEQIPLSAWNAFPIPADDYIDIELPVSPDPSSIQLINATGHTLMSVALPSSATMHRINVQSVAPGMYFIVLTQGRSTGVQRVTIVKQ